MGRQIPVQGGGEPAEHQVCRCHTNRKAPNGQLLYKPGNWKVPKGEHLVGCPELKRHADAGVLFLTSG